MRTQRMSAQHISTNLGEISVSQIASLTSQPEATPLLFLHGIFLDKSLWFDCSRGLMNYRRIYIDMPAHGQSSDVGRPWSLDDCVTLLIQILDVLAIDTCIAIGHSWGSMTALRAAVQYPHRFQGLGLFNMPMHPPTGRRRMGFQLQKILAHFQWLYAQQAAKSMYAGDCLKARPELIKQMQERLANRSGQEISRIIDAVILASEDSTSLIQSLQIPTLFVVGESDFVEFPPGETLIVPGRHISPHEAPMQTTWAIEKLIHQVDICSQDGNISSK